MKVSQWLAINRRGITKVRKTKPDLGWDEIAVKIQLNIPDELFRRPTIEANLVIENVPNNAYNPDIIINTKELIEQQTGAKIDFTVQYPDRPTEGEQV
jgi:hypothetical protein